MVHIYMEPENETFNIQVSALEASFSENSDILGINGGRGLSQDYIKKLPKCKFSPNSRKRPGYATSCIVCLEVSTLVLCYI